MATDQKSVGEKLLFLVIGVPLLVAVAFLVYLMSPLLLVILPLAYAGSALMSGAHPWRARILSAAAALIFVPLFVVAALSPVHAVARVVMADWEQIKPHGSAEFDLVIAACGIGFALLALMHLVAVVRKMSTITNTPTVKVRDASRGICEFHGVARRAEPALEGRQVDVAGRDTRDLDPPRDDAIIHCWKRTRVEGYGKRRRSITVEQTMTRRFYLEDDTGRILVDPTGAPVWNGEDFIAWQQFPRVLIATQTKRDPDERTAIQEQAIVPGQAVYLIGSVERNTQGAGGDWIVRSGTSRSNVFGPLGVLATTVAGFAEAVTGRRRTFLLSDVPELRTHSKLLGAARYAIVTAAVYLLLPGHLAVKAWPKTQGAIEAQAAQADAEGAAEQMDDLLSRLASADPARPNAVVTEAAYWLQHNRGEVVDFAERVIQRRSPLAARLTLRALQHVSSDEGHRAVLMLLDRCRDDSEATLAAAEALAIHASERSENVESDAADIDALTRAVAQRPPDAPLRASLIDMLRALCLRRPAAASRTWVGALRQPEDKAVTHVILEVLQLWPDRPTSFDEPLLRAAKHADAGIRARAIDALVARENPWEHEPSILAALKDDSPDVRLAALGLFDRISGPATIPHFAPLCDDPHAEIRRIVHGHLHRYNALAAPRFVARLLQAAREAPTAARRADAMLALGCLGPKFADQTVPVLVAALDSRDTIVRVRAAEALGHLGQAARPALDRLVLLGADSDAALQTSARRAADAVARGDSTTPTLGAGTEVQRRHLLHGHLKGVADPMPQVIPILTRHELSQCAKIVREKLPAMPENEVLLLITSAPARASNQFQGVTRLARRDDGRLVIELVGTILNKPRRTGTFHAYMLIAVPRDGWVGVAGCVEANGSPWHGTVHETFRLP